MLAVHNFILDLSAFLALCVLKRRRVRAGRLLLGAAAGTAFGILAFLGLHSQIAYLLAMHFVINPAALYAAFGERSLRELAADWCVSYFVFLFLGGVMDWLYGEMSWCSYELASVLTLFLTVLASLWVKQWLKNKVRYLSVAVTQGEQRLSLWALCDSGNLLHEPYTKKPVSMIARGVYERAFGAADAVRLVPYESLGCSGGLLEVVTVTQLCVYNGKQKICIRQAVVGLASDDLFSGKKYQMIVNPQELTDDKT